MKTIDYGLIDYLGERIQDAKDDMRLYIKDEDYELAAIAQREANILESVVEVIKNTYIEEMSDAEKEDEYIYLNEDNWMDYWNKKVQVSNKGDFSQGGTKGRLVGYSLESKQPYRISNGTWYKYAKVRKED